MKNQPLIPKQLSSLDTEALIGYLLLYRREYWVNVIEPVTAEVYDVIVLVCTLKLISHICTSNIKKKNNSHLK